MKNYLARNNRNDFGFGFNDVFDDFFKPVAFGFKETAMKTDVKEKENGYELSVDMPGFEKKDIELTLSDGYLTVSARREENEKDKFIRRERSYSCSRSYYVGENVTEEDIKAKYDKGILTVDFPKKENKIEKRRNIEIE